MTLTPFVVERFAGLNLVGDPLEVGSAGAVDLKNAWLNDGRVETCPTVSAYATAAKAVKRIYAHPATQIIASENDGTNTTLEAFNLGGTLVAATTYAAAFTAPHGFASIGTPGASRTYCVRLGDTTRRWDGSAWSTVAGVPSGVAAAPADNGTRLAVGYSGSNPDRVSFSNAGDPETFGASNYVDISPGDGETICDVVTWQNLTFAFKNTKFAVFYGNSVDSTGSSVFNYRMVDTGTGIGDKGLVAYGGACVAPEGVYFVGRDGIYFTRGAEPVLVSQPISPLWPSTEANPLTTVPRIASTFNGHDLAMVHGDLYYSAAAVVVSAKKATFVRHGGEWTYLDIQENGTTSTYANFTSLRDTAIYTIPGSTSIKQLSLASGPDSSLAWSWKSGRYALADPSKVAVTDYSSLTGSGTVTLRIDTDKYSAQSASATLGVAPAIAEGWPSPLDQEGKWVQSTLSGTGAASVNRLRHNVSFVRSGD